MTILIIYITIFVAAFYIVKAVSSKSKSRDDFTSLKTVTFGDESAVIPNRAASVISVFAIFVIWAAFTGSKLIPFHVPGPFIGEFSFTYTAVNSLGETDDADVRISVYDVQTGEIPDKIDMEPGSGFALNDTAQIVAWRSALIKVKKNDIGGKDKKYKIIAINGESIKPNTELFIDDARVYMTAKGTLSLTPYKGWQMQPIWLPSPEAVWSRLIKVSSEGYKNFSLFEHLGWSLLRVIVGFVAGALIGIPLGYAMGLSGWFRGWFDPIVEFMRPVPPLALIPLVIIWFGIGESSKIAILWMGTFFQLVLLISDDAKRVPKEFIELGYTLGAKPFNITRDIVIRSIFPSMVDNLRICLGWCWTWIILAEIVAANTGIGHVIWSMRRFVKTPEVMAGILTIGIIPTLIIP